MRFPKLLSGPYQRCKAHREIGLKALRDRQQLLVPPDVRRPRGYAFACKLAANLFQVILHFERRKALIAS